MIDQVFVVVDRFPRYLFKLTQKNEYNLSKFCEHDKSKTIEANNLKQSSNLKKVHTYYACNANKSILKHKREILHIRAVHPLHISGFEIR